MMSETMILSTTLVRIEVIEIGRYSACIEGTGVFIIGQISVCFHCTGTVYVSIDKLKSLDNGL